MEEREDEQTRTATRRPLFEPAPQEDLVAPAQTIGRFMVLGRVGSGGMGQVYAAYDPVLDRRVALKLLHAERSERDREGLVREAKALARLSHPNVVAVHDVGVHEGLVFLAMEFVEGSTLKAWMGREHGLAPRLEVLEQAALGLMAAHEAGLVHGDFKPHNVLVGDDGRVRVADFGLARPEHRGTSTKTVRNLDQTETSEEDSRQVVAGTPAYMAPEHLRQGQVDPRTDQYSYCVSAWEVLYGCRPPEVVTPLELPGGLSAALKKGLSARPTARHASMERLARALQAALAEVRGDRSRRMRRGIAAVGGVAVLGAVVGGYRIGQADGVSPCSGGEGQLDEVWNDDSRASVSTAILATEVPYAEHTRAGVVERLDAFGEAWVEGYTEACEASQVRREQSAEVMDLRMACLDQKRRELRAAVDVLGTLGAEEVENALRVAEGLRAPEDCADLDYVRERARVPAEPRLRERVAELRDAIAEAQAVAVAGRYAEAKSAAEEIVVSAEALGFDPLLAEAKLLLGQRLDAVEDHEAAAAMLEEAFLLAQTVGDGEVAARAASSLSSVVGFEGLDFDLAMLWSDIGLATARRADDASQHSLPEVLSGRGGVLLQSGDLETAITTYDEVLDAVEVGSLSYANALAGRGNVRDGLGDVAGAVEDLSAAAAVFEEHRGSQHPSVANLKYNLVGSLQKAGHHEDALRMLRDVRAIYQALYGPDGYDVGTCAAAAARSYGALGDRERALGEHREALRIYKGLGSLDGSRALDVGAEYINTAITLAQLGRSEEAVESVREGLSILERLVGNKHPYVLTGINTYGNLLADLGRSREAEVLFEEALANLQDESGDEREELIRTNLGLLYAERGELQRALEQYERALEIIGTDFSAPSSQITLVNTANVWLELGQPDKALEAGEKLLRISSEDPTMVAFQKFLVGRALWATGGDRARALRLVTEAESTYSELGVFPLELEDMRNWLKAHR